MIYEKYIQDRREEPLLCYCDQDIDLPSGSRFGPVIRDIYIIECCTAGSGSVIINDREFHMQAGDCFFLMPGDTVIHTTDHHATRSDVWCAVDGLQVGVALARAGIRSDAPFAPHSVYDDVRASIEQMLAMRQEVDPGAELRRTACIYALLGALLRTCALADRSLPVQKAIGLIETCYAQSLTVQTIAASVGLERSYFSTVFKAETGMSPHAYLTSLRVRKACVLLREHHYSVAEAAEAVGLDVSNFARLFRRVTGVSPREYVQG